MNPLPQRKKTAEEIAQLRESLGAAGPQPPVAAPSPPPTGSPAPPLWEAPPAPVQPIEARLPKPKLTAVDLVAEAQAKRPVEQVQIQPRVVRSLRKSEQGPVPVMRPSIESAPPDSKIPLRRHSDQALNEIRRREFVGQVVPPIPPHSVSAHPVLLIFGYLFALGSPVCIFFHLHVAIPGALAITALLISIFIFLKKPYSRPHAGFIGIIALFVLIFGALYYFPQLRNAA